MEQERIVPIHNIFHDIGEEKAQALPFFHAFTGCDQVSFLSHVTKISAWKVWQSFDEITRIFSMLSQHPILMQVEEARSVFERFTVLLYSHTSNLMAVNECRRALFCQGRSIDNIPPTGEALKMHTLRSSYIAGHIWGQSTVPKQTLPEPNAWGWKEEDGKFFPYWTTLPEAAAGIRDLVKCSCNLQKGCKGRCKCVQSELQCTELCRCKGQCERD